MTTGTMVQRLTMIPQSIQRAGWIQTALLVITVLLPACESPVETEGPLLIQGVEITDMQGDLVAASHTEHDHWHFAGSSESLHLHAGEHRDLRIYFVTAAGERRQFPAAGAEHIHRVTLLDTAVAAYEGESEHGRLVGLAVGETEARVQVVHDHGDELHVEWESPPLPLEVAPPH